MRIESVEHLGRRVGVLACCIILGMYGVGYAQVCGTGAGDCCAPNGTPGCDDVDCCETMCAIDAYCCETVWDSICAAEAAEVWSKSLAADVSVRICWPFSSPNVRRGGRTLPERRLAICHSGQELAPVPFFVNLHNKNQSRERVSGAPGPSSKGGRFNRQH